MAYITAQDVAAIRKELKEKLPKWKFSVTKSSGGLAVSVTIREGSCGFAGVEYEQVNQYRISEHWEDKEDARVLSMINEIMHHAPGRADPSRKYYDRSDSQSDYFDTAFYVTLSIGSWDRPYKQSETVTS